MIPPAETTVDRNNFKMQVDIQKSDSRTYKHANTEEAIISGSEALQSDPKMKVKTVGTDTNFDQAPYLSLSLSNGFGFTTKGINLSK